MPGEDRPRRTSSGERPTLQLVAQSAITTVFQPIVDVVSASTVAYELLSRGPGPDSSPERMFELARQRGETWDVERACRSTAMRRIAALPGEMRGTKFFLNVSPDIFSDPRFIQGFTLQQMEKYGLHQDDVVIEITERDSIRDRSRFVEIVRHYVDQGFKIAVDDFGSGHSSLVTLLAVLPHYIKLDMAVVRDLHKHPYQQLLVKSLVSFAASVQAKLIAEGVETWDELETLVRLGVRYMQGYLLARPNELPPAITSDVTAGIRAAVRRNMLAGSDIEEVARTIALSAPTVTKGTPLSALEERFRADPSLDHVVLVEGTRPEALVTRRQIAAGGSGRVGGNGGSGALVESAARWAPLMVPDTLQVTTLAKLAMERSYDELYDPAIVVDAAGVYVGTVTVKQIVTRSAEIESRISLSASPLTGLPGPQLVDAWIRRALERDAFTVVFGDLDHFREYNDRYGYAMGDELIRLLARVLGTHAPNLCAEARLGHRGGDDFVIVCSPSIEEPVLAAICSEFDTAKRELFEPADLARGAFMHTDRQGHAREIPIVTASLAVLQRAQLGNSPHPALLWQVATTLKQRVKRWTGDHRQSGFFFERRMHP